MARNTNSYRVLILGCGQLGSRHLQAASSLPMVREIEIVDPRPEALEVARKLLTDTPKRQYSISFRWGSSIEEASKGGDLCILATQAGGRSQLLQEVALKLGYKSFLLEKIVEQSVEKYEDLVHFVKEKKISAWVNCKTRAYPVHKWIKSRIPPNEPITYSEVGGNHGLANNGIHSADLFTFYDEACDIKNVGTQIDSVLHPSKRGPDLFDLSGSLYGLSDKGSHFMLSFSSKHVHPSIHSIVTSKYRWVVDHVQRWAFESSIASDGMWKPIPFEGNLLVSEMTKAFVTDILTSGRCELPTLQDCLPAHRFVLGSLLPHFNKLSKVKRDYCPVT